MEGKANDVLGHIQEPFCLRELPVIPHPRNTQNTNSVSEGFIFKTAFKISEVSIYPSEGMHWQATAFSFYQVLNI